MNETKNFHAVSVKFLPATNTRGARVKLYSGRFKDSKIIPYNYQYNNIADLAIDWLKDKGQKVMGQAEYNNSDIIMLDSINNTFTPLKEMEK